MLKIEKKLIELVERHILLIAVLILTALAFLLRKQCIWYNSIDYINYFNKHSGHVQSTLYYQIVYLLGYLPMLPIHGMKWLTAAGDIGVAILFILLIGKRPIDVGEKLRYLMFYAVFLFSPVFLLRGIVWAQPDSLAMVFLMGALFLERRGQKVISICLAAMGTAIYPIMILPVLLYLLCGVKNRGWKLLTNVVIFLLVLGVILTVNGTFQGLTVTESLWSGLRWMNNHPYTGDGFLNVSEWIHHMILAYGYTFCILSAVVAFQRKLPYVAAAGVHIGTAVYFGMVLFVNVVG